MDYTIENLMRMIYLMTNSKYESYYDLNLDGIISKVDIMIMIYGIVG